MANYPIDWKNAKQFIRQLAEDEHEDAKYRSAAADILCCSNSDTEDVMIGKAVINKLGELYSTTSLDDETLCKVNIDDKVRSNVFERMQSNLRLLPKGDQKMIIEDITSEIGEKATLKEFLVSYSVYDELKLEFVNTKLMDEERFNMIYNKTLKDFSGIEI